MADLNEIQAAQSIKIIGADGTGSETTPVSSTLNGDINSADTIRVGGIQGTLTVGTSAVELKVGGSRLANRKLASVFNDSNSIIYYGYTDAVTISTGTPIFKNQFVEWAINDSTTVYLIADSAGNNTRITEAA